jgi:hypothetical protein
LGPLTGQGLVIRIVCLPSVHRHHGARAASMVHSLHVQRQRCIRTRRMRHRGDGPRWAPTAMALIAAPMALIAARPSRRRCIRVSIAHSMRTHSMRTHSMRMHHHAAPSPSRIRASQSRHGTQSRRAPCLAWTRPLAEAQGEHVSQGSPSNSVARACIPCSHARVAPCNVRARVWEPRRRSGVAHRAPRRRSGVARV